MMAMLTAITALRILSPDYNGSRITLKHLAVILTESLYLVKVQEERVL